MILCLLALTTLLIVTHRWGILVLLCTEMSYKVGPRLRQSRLLALSGRRGRVHATYGPFFRPALYVQHPLYIACAVFRVWQGDLSATKFPRSDQITRAQKKLITTTAACRRNQHRLTDEGIKDNLLLLLLPSFHHYTDPFDGDFHAVGSRGRTPSICETWEASLTRQSSHHNA